MRKDLQENAGLGSPPSKFTTNASESLNAKSREKLILKNPSGQNLMIKYDNMLSHSVRK